MSETNPEKMKLKETAQSLEKTLKIVEQFTELLKQLQAEVDKKTKEASNEISSTFQVTQLSVGSIKTETENTLESNKASFNNSSDNLNNQLNNYILSYSDDLLDIIKTHVEGFHALATKITDESEKSLVEKIDHIKKLVDDSYGEHQDKSKGIEDKMLSLAEKFPNELRKKYQAISTEKENELREILKLRQEEVTKSLNKLQHEFRENITNQIGRVFEGVTRMKAQLEEIVEDTLNQLRENLSRINKGIDEYFIDEMNSTQDLLVQYESKLLETVDEIIKDYETEAERIIKSMREQSNENIDAVINSLTEEVSSFKQSLLNLREEFDTEIRETRIKVYDTLENIKEEVIKIHGEQQDDLDTQIKNLFSNITNTKEKSASEVKNKVDTEIANVKREINNQIKEGLDNIKHHYDEIIKELKKSEISVTGQIGMLRKELTTQLQSNTEKLEKESMTAKKQLNDTMKKL